MLPKRQRAHEDELAAYVKSSEEDAIVVILDLIKKYNFTMESLMKRLTGTCVHCAVFVESTRFTSVHVQRGACA
jgi:hypothetical protein